MFESDVGSCCFLVTCNCYSCSRHAESRRRKRKEEARQDAVDQEAEEAERAAAHQKQQEEVRLRADGQLPDQSALFVGCLLATAFASLLTHRAQRCVFLSSAASLPCSCDSSSFCHH